MKQQFSCYRFYGIYYTPNTRNGKQESLRTRDEAAAKALLHSKNESVPPAEPEPPDRAGLPQRHPRRTLFGCCLGCHIVRMTRGA